MLYAIKSDTLFFNRQANRADLDAFSFLYPLADASLTLFGSLENSSITNLIETRLAQGPQAFVRLKD